MKFISNQTVLIVLLRGCSFQIWDFQHPKRRHQIFELRPTRTHFADDNFSFIRISPYENFIGIKGEFMRIRIYSLEDLMPERYPQRSNQFSQREILSVKDNEEEHKEPQYKAFSLKDKVNSHLDDWFSNHKKLNEACEINHETAEKGKIEVENLEEKKEEIVEESATDPGDLRSRWLKIKEKKEKKIEQERAQIQIQENINEIIERDQGENEIFASAILNEIIDAVLNRFEPEGGEMQENSGKNA